MTLLTSSPSIPRIGDLLERLGGIPADRVRYYPLPVREMDRKRGEYFDAGVRLVWMVDPPTRKVFVYHSRQEPLILTEADTLTGDPVLPGFKIDLRGLFAKIDT